MTSTDFSIGPNLDALRELAVARGRNTILREVNQLLIESLRTGHDLATFATTFHDHYIREY